MKLKQIAAVAMVVTFLCAVQILSAEAKPKEVKNVIILIPDGMSLAPTTLARWMKGSALSFDQYVCGLVETYSSDSTIADSAPAGSAYSTGFKSQSGNIASLGKIYNVPGFLLPEVGGENRPVATVLEAAKLSGRATGMIATSEFMHATPADFASHDPSRKSYDSISEQIIFNNLDVVLGGGAYFLQAENRNDKDNLLASVTARGYSFVNTTAGMKAANTTKLFGLFAPKAMAYNMDRDTAIEPSIAEMTDKAISILSANKKGFFLMVEGSKVDWAAHANDPVGIVGDILAFDEACKVAFDYARSNRDTVVIVVSDHGNSGFSIGDKSTNGNYDKTNYSVFTDQLKKASRTGEGLEVLINVDKSNVKEIVAQYYGLTDLSETEVDLIKKAPAGGLNAVVGPMMGLRAKIGFTTTGHTGEDVVISIFDPNGNRPCGVMENTEIASYIARSLGLDLNATTKKIFVDASEAFKAKNAEVSIDSTTDPANIRLVAKKGSIEISMIQNRDYAIVTGIAKNTKGIYVLGFDSLGRDILAIRLEGVTVFNGSKWFISQNIIDVIK